MSGLDLFFFVGFIWVVAWVLRNALRRGGDLVEQGRRTLENLADSMRDAEVQTPPGPRGTPRVTRPVARKPGALKPSSRTGTTPARAPTRAGTSLDAWYLVLDVSANASRREIQEALKLRLARAHANRDSEAAQRVMRAAAAGMAHRAD